MRKKLFITLAAFLCCFSMLKAEEVYRDAHVRFTLIDDGTIRLEYAPDGKFVDNKSFVAVVRQFPKVDATVKDTKKQLTISTNKMVLTYTKSSGEFNAKNLKIQSTKNADIPFVWTPGTKQQNNLKGTYRTLDGYNGDSYAYGGGTAKIPLEDGIVSTDGWTLIDDSKSLLFDGATDWDWVTERTSAEGAQDWIFMSYGYDFKGALKSYTKFAGRMPLPPRYAFGYWWSRYWSYSDQDFRDLIEKFKQSDLPLDVLVIDMDWHPISAAAGGGWTGWDWNENLFPDYKQFLTYLDKEGVKATMNLHPADGVRPYEKKYKEFIQRAGIKEGESTQWLGSNKQYVKAIFDTYLHPYMNEGVDFWWLDWQQWGNDKKINSLSNTFWCNYIFFTDMEKNGNKRPMLYHRWGGLGNHRYQVGFSGDSYITWKSLDYLPYFNSTASNVLYGYWSHDIGGHQNINWSDKVEPQLYTRAMQMGEYLPILRTHSTKNANINKEPWSFNEATRDRLSKVIKGRYTLVPYIYTMAREAYETGVSLCRPLYYDYPKNKEAYDFRNQYMFGDNMIIAPITAPVDSTDGFARLKVWLPEGEWLEYETGTMLKGNQTLERPFNLDEYPVYVKAGSILPYYDNAKNLSGNNQTVTVRVFPGSDNGEFTLYEDNGEDANYVEQYATTKLSYSRNGNQLSVTIEARNGQYKDMPAQRNFKLALPCQLAPKSVTVNGKTTDFTYDGNNLETIINLGSLNCATATTISIQMPEDYALTDGLKSKFYRIRTAVATYKQHRENMVYTKPFAYLEATPMRLSYHPDTQAQTIKQFNEYYDNLSAVVLEQTSNLKDLTTFMQLTNETARQNEALIPNSCFKTAQGEGFDVKFYNNQKLEGEPVLTKHLNSLGFDTFNSVAEGVNRDHWSLTATSEFTSPIDGEIIVMIGGDDGYRMFVDDKELVGDWRDHVLTTKKAKLSVKAGQTYKIKIDYYDNTNDAILSLVMMKSTNVK